MQFKLAIVLAVSFGLSVTVNGQDVSAERPAELTVLKASLGVWDAAIEVWPEGPDSPSIQFKGVETIRPYGEYWIASDFDSEYMGETMKVHSIVGYDLDQKKLVGTIIDHGPYAATMAGQYDQESQTVHWTTQAKDPSGKRMVQKTTVTQESADQRVLVLSVPGEQENEPVKFMQIRFVKRE